MKIIDKIIPDVAEYMTNAGYKDTGGGAWSRSDNMKAIVYDDRIVFFLENPTWRKPLRDEDYKLDRVDIISHHVMTVKRISAKKLDKVKL